MSRIKLLTFVIKKDAIDKLKFFKWLAFWVGQGVGWRRLFGGVCLFVLGFFFWGGVEGEGGGVLVESGVAGF